MQRIGAFMMDVIAAIEDDGHRARTAELFTDSEFHGRVTGETSMVVVQTLTPEGYVVLARINGPDVGYVVGPDGRPRYLR
ncbi:MAG TPA: hypothetical protein VF065_04545 [Ilumatobacter sp.]